MDIFNPPRISVSKRFALTVVAMSGLVFASPLFAAKAATDQSAVRPFANLDRIVDNFNRLMDSTWSKNDQPYTDIRARIDAQSFSGKAPGDILKDTLRAYPSDDAPVNLFARGYVAWSTNYYFDRHTPDADTSYGLVKQIGDTIFYKASVMPHTYNFVRLAYLLDGDIGGDQMTHVGLKLLKHTPSDRGVAFELTMALLETDGQANIDMATTLAQRDMKAHPSDSRSCSVLAYAYYCQYNEKNDKRKAFAAIALLQRATSLAPYFPGRRKFYQDGIAAIRDQLAGGSQRW